MTVRAKIGRRRYILFEYEGGLSYSRFNRALERAFFALGLRKEEAGLRTIVVMDGIGIVRCSHIYRERVTEILNSMKVDGSEIITLRTSGTLKTLKDWLREERDIHLPGRRRVLRRGKTIPNIGINGSHRKDF